MGAFVSVPPRDVAARPGRTAVRPELVHDALPPLPLSLVLAIAERLPAEDKLCLALVSPAFRAVADDTRLWRDVKLGACVRLGVAWSGLDRGYYRRVGAVLLAVSVKARGTLQSLGLSRHLLTDEHTRNVLETVCAENAATLVELSLLTDTSHMDDAWWQLKYKAVGYDRVAQLLAAAPQLRRVDADVCCTSAEAVALLRAGVVRAHVLHVSGFNNGAGSMAALTAAAASAAVQPAFERLVLDGAPLGNAAGNAALDAVVDVAGDQRLRFLLLTKCNLGADSMPALARLLGRGSLATLAVSYEWGHAPLTPSPGFCSALRSSRTLTRLALVCVRLFDDPLAGVGLLAAATGHPTLAFVDVSGNTVAPVHRPAVGAALGRLVGANAPALLTLRATTCDLGDEGASPLVAALAGNTRLRSLSICVNLLTRALAAPLLAAARANTGLLHLCVINPYDTYGGEGAWWRIGSRELIQVERFVREEGGSLRARSRARLDMG